MNYDPQMTTTQDGQDTLGISSGPDPKIQRLLESSNVAEKLDEQELLKIGEQCKRDFDLDLQSREHWERDMDEWLKLAMQVREPKSFPWPKASNVKYPLLSTASMQFAARAYPSLVPSDGKVVKVEVIGEDQDGQKQLRADRVATYMSYQVMKQIDSWEEDMDKLLMMLPICGTVFKKTFFNKNKNKVDSYLVSPKNLVVNYWARSLESAERISEILEIPQRVFKERQAQKFYTDVVLDDPSFDELLKNSGNDANIPDDTSVPYIFIEQHTYLDLDDDGFMEPYIVTFERKSGSVLRITPRFKYDQVETDEKGKITSIESTCMYTKFSFVPNPDGSFYDLGFGLLLGPLNESVNSIINQLIDAGTLSNLQSGFIGKGLRIKMGDARFTPGEWKPVNATADDLRKQIVPLPAKDPSNVLFQLMGSLITSGKELASVAEIFTGKMPGQNTPATTTMASVEQGMKVFTAVYKRIFRSLGKEFKRIFDLNSTYLDPNTYSAILDSTIDPNDFNNESYDICPGADPSAASTQERLMKAQALLELLPTGILDPVEVISRVLQAQEQPNWQKLFSQQVQQTGQVPQQPDPKMQEMQMKAQLEQQKFALQAQGQQQKMELESRDKQQQMVMKDQEHRMEMQHKMQMANIQAAAEDHKQKIFSAQQQAQMNQQLVHGEQAHQQKMQQSKEIQKSLQSKTGSTGSRTQRPKRS